MPSKYKRRPRDFDYLLWVKSLSCAVPDLKQRLAGMLEGDPAAIQAIGHCEGVTEADHVLPKGTGMKGADYGGACCLCVRHHRLPGIEALLHGLVPKGYVRAWKREMAEWLRVSYESIHE